MPVQNSKGFIKIKNGVRVTDHAGSMPQLNLAKIPASAFGSKVDTNRRSI
jgi:hypothetical protein